MSEEGEKFIAALDVGTTKIKCLVFDQDLQIRGEHSVLIKLEYTRPGWVEINPDTLWEQVNFVIKTAVRNAKVSPKQIQGLSISTQRSTFMCWDTNNNINLHNIICWKDLRADSLVRQWNSSLYFKSFRTACKLLYGITRNKRYLAGSVLRVMNEQVNNLITHVQVVMRLLWVFQNIPDIQEKLAKNQIRYGTLDTFLVYKFTDGEKHVTDYSNASPTGFFDPFENDWASWALQMFSIPSSILPTLVPTVGNHFGYCRIFPETNIPILCVIADQSASLFGSTSFHRGNVKVTLGTGAFLDVNTGKKPHASVNGIYPLVAWKYDSELVYMAEGNSKDNGLIVDWGKTIGLYEHVEDSSRIAESVRSSNGVYFIPGFNGLQAPYNDPCASAGFIGVTPQTEKAHMVRALLESLAFRVQQLLNVLQTETDFTFDCVRVDGGVAKNNFVLQAIANLTGKRVERPVCTEMTAQGSAFMAGIQAGIWKNREELEYYYKVEKIFLPKIEEEEGIQTSFVEWERALDRFLHWSKKK